MKPSHLATLIAVGAAILVGLMIRAQLRGPEVIRASDLPPPKTCFLFHPSIKTRDGASPAKVIVFPTERAALLASAAVRQRDLAVYQSVVRESAAAGVSAGTRATERARKDGHVEIVLPEGGVGFVSEDECNRTAPSAVDSP